MNSVSDSRPSDGKYATKVTSDSLVPSTAFAFTSHVGAVTSSVLNTAKRVIIIVVSSVVFQEAMERNTVVGSAIAILGTFAYSLASKKAPAKTKIS